MLDALSRDFRLVTVRCSCDYREELTAFDEVRVRMSLAELTQNRITMAFDYWRADGGRERLVARGEQQVACMRWIGHRLVPAPVPQELASALDTYGQEQRRVECQL